MITCHALVSALVVLNANFKDLAQLFDYLNKYRLHAKLIQNDVRIPEIISWNKYEVQIPKPYKQRGRCSQTGQ